MEFDVLLLSRIQFALTVGFHYLYPPLSIGLGVVLVLAESLYLWTRQQRYRDVAKFWTRVFGLTFSIGVATGIVMEFEFGTNWAAYSRFVGDIFGSALGAEGIFAFFLESSFLSILVFGWGRVSDRLHYLASWMVCLGSHLSAVWIVVANSWMQTPAGYHLVEHPLGMRAEITDFWQMVFNPSSLHRLSHTLIGAWLAGAFLVISISAWYMLKQRYRQFAHDSLRIALPMATVALLLSAVTGHISAQGVARNQPTKMAAFEALFETTPRAGLSLFGWVDLEQERLHGLALPGALSYLLYGELDAPVKGLKEYDQELWPPLQLSFQSYHLMVALWGAMGVAVAVAWSALRSGSSRSWSFQRWCWRFLASSILFPMVANEAGWVAAEVGRQPWIVWGLLKTRQGLSPNVDRDLVALSLILFTCIYFLLFVLFLLLLCRKVEEGPNFLQGKQQASPSDLANPTLPL